MTEEMTGVIDEKKTILQEVVQKYRDRGPLGKGKSSETVSSDELSKLSEGLNRELESDSGESPESAPDTPTQKHDVIGGDEPQTAPQTLPPIAETAGSSAPDVFKVAFEASMKSPKEDKSEDFSVHKAIEKRLEEPSIEKILLIDPAKSNVEIKRQYVEQGEQILRTDLTEAYQYIMLKGSKDSQGEDLPDIPEYLKRHIDTAKGLRFDLPQDIVEKGKNSPEQMQAIKNLAEQNANNAVDSYFGVTIIPPEQINWHKDQIRKKNSEKNIRDANGNIAEPTQGQIIQSIREYVRADNDPKIAKAYPLRTKASLPEFPGKVQEQADGTWKVQSKESIGATHRAVVTNVAEEAGISMQDAARLATISAEYHLLATQGPQNESFSESVMSTPEYQMATRASAVKLTLDRPISDGENIDIVKTKTEESDRRTFNTRVKEVAASIDQALESGTYRQVRELTPPKTNLKRLTRP